MSERPACKTCRWWSAHSLDLRMGDCMVPGDHRFSHVPIETTGKDGKVRRSIAYLDSFGREETRPNFVCGRWSYGETEAKQP